MQTNNTAEKTSSSLALNQHGEDNVGNTIVRRFFDKNRNRVLTLAYQVVGNEVYYGFAVCKPNKTKTGMKPYSQGDAFVKREGRQRALGRLCDFIMHGGTDNSGSTPALPGEVSQVFTVLKELVRAYPKTSIARIASDYLASAPNPTETK